jgi:hypothetical protein
MMYVDFEEVNNDNFSEPSSELRSVEQETNKRENDLIYGKIIESLAHYIKDYKERAVKILNKHRIQTGNSDQEVVNAVVEMLFRGDKAFKDDLVTDMMETGAVHEEGNENESSAVGITIAVISAISALGSGGLQVWGKSKETKAQKEQMKAEIIRSISEQKRAEMEAKSKGKRLMTIVIVSVLLILIVAIAFIYLKQRKKTVTA